MTEDDLSTEGQQQTALANQPSVHADGSRVKKQFFKFDPLASIFGLLVIYLSSQVVAALLVSSYANVVESDGQQREVWLSSSTVAQFLFVIIAEVISIHLTIQLARLARRKASQIGIVRPRLIDLVRAVLGWVVYFKSFIVIMLVATAVTSMSIDQQQNIGFNQARSLQELFLVFLSLVVFVPIAEEVMFRGFLFSSLRAKYRFIPAATITSILFGVAHLYNGADSPLLWAVALDTLVLSYIMCYLRDRCGSLWPAIFMHMIKNGVAFMALFGSRILT